MDEQRILLEEELKTINEQYNQFEQRKIFLLQQIEDKLTDTEVEEEKRIKSVDPLCLRLSKVEDILDDFVIRKAEVLSMKLLIYYLFYFILLSFIFFCSTNFFL